MKTRQVLLNTIVLPPARRKSKAKVKKLVASPVVVVEKVAVAKPRKLTRAERWAAVRAKLPTCELQQKWVDWSAQYTAPVS